MYTPAKKPVHLVKNFHEVPASKRDTVLLGSEKVDGVYCFLRKGICYSRTGKEYISGVILHTMHQLLCLMMWSLVSSCCSMQMVIPSQ